MHWRDSWTYGIRELVTEAPTRQQERVLGHIKMIKGHITGFLSGSDRTVASAYYYDNYGVAQPERYREVERKVMERSKDEEATFQSKGMSDV